MVRAHDICVFREMTQAVEFRRQAAARPPEQHVDDAQSITNWLRHLQTHCRDVMRGGITSNASTAWGSLAFFRNKGADDLAAKTTHCSSTRLVIANATTICVSQRNISRTKAEMAEPHSTGAKHHASTGTPAARSCASTRDAKEAVWMSFGPSKCMDTTVRPHCSSVRLRSSVPVVNLVFLPLASTKKWLGPSTSTATLPSGHSSSTSTTREPSPTGCDAYNLRCRGQMPVGNTSQVSFVRILTRKGQV